jgi:putative membrane protein
MVITGRFLESMECTLTDRSLKFKKGLLNRTERTVPLDKITDVGLVQGPIMRAFDLEAISVETAGQSTVGATIQITGIEGTREFRDAILTQKDKLTGHDEQEQAAITQAPAASIDSGDLKPILTDMAATLKRIEILLSKQNQS